MLQCCKSTCGFLSPYLPASDRGFKYMWKVIVGAIIVGFIFLGLILLNSSTANPTQEESIRRICDESAKMHNIYRYGHCQINTNIDNPSENTIEFTDVDRYITTSSTPTQGLKMEDLKSLNSE